MKWFSSSRMKYFTPKNVLSIISIWPRHAQNCLMIISSVRSLVFSSLSPLLSMCSLPSIECALEFDVHHTWTDAHTLIHNARSNHSFSSFLVVFFFSLCCWWSGIWEFLLRRSFHAFRPLESIEFRYRFRAAWKRGRQIHVHCAIVLVYDDCTSWILFGIHLNLYHYYCNHPMISWTEEPKKSTPSTPLLPFCVCASFVRI